MPLQIYTKSIKFRKYHDFFGINSKNIAIFTETRVNCIINDASF